MKKKIIALSIAFVLVVGAAIGTTLAYLTDSGSVLNTFAVGDITIDATEYVDHTNASGTEDKETDGDITTENDPYEGFKEIALFDQDGEAITNAGHEYKDILPGDVLHKEIVAGADKASYFAVSVKVTEGVTFEDALELDDAAWDDAVTANLGIDYTAANPAITTAQLIAIEKSTIAVGDTDVVYIFYYYVPAGQSLTLNLDTQCPTTVSGAEFNDFAIDVQVAAIQADNTGTASDAIAALNAAVPPLA